MKKHNKKYVGERVNVQKIPSTSAGLIGTRLIHMGVIASPQTDRKSLEEVVSESAGGIPSLCPSWQLMLLTVWIAVSLQPRRNSATKGMNVTPTEWHA